MFTIRHLPRFSRVCFCCPLRIGNIILVYINLVLSLGICSILIVLEYIKLFFRLMMPREFDAMHRMVRFKTIPFAAAFMIMLYALAEICMSVVVLIGFHKNRHKYILVYMYYTIFTSILLALSRIFDMENQIWYMELSTDAIFFVFKAYYVLSIRSQIKIMECPDDGDEVDTSRDIEMKISGDETQETDLNAQSVKNIERILNDETLDSEYEISEFGSSDALVQ